MERSEARRGGRRREKRSEAEESEAEESEAEKNEAEKTMHDPRVGGCHGGGLDEPRAARTKGVEGPGEFLEASGG